MPRPASWLPRLFDITRSVSASVRSHYERQDLERLFDLQPRAAQKLLQLLPTTEIGTGHLASREDLLVFLQRVRDAEDPTALFNELRSQKNAVSKRKLRSFAASDLPAASFTSLPSGVSLDSGRLQVSFGTVDDLAEKLMWVAQLISEQTEDFANAYEPQQPIQVDEAAEEVRRMFADLELMEAKHKGM